MSGLIKKEDIHKSFWQENISNPNILINGDFRINQRKQQIYSENYKYTVDRWLLSNWGLDEMTHGSLTKRDEGISLTGAKSKQLYITQILEIENSLKLSNQFVTLSVDMYGDNIISGNVFIQVVYEDKDKNVKFGKKIIEANELKSNWERYSVSLKIDGDTTKVYVQIGTFEEAAKGYCLINEDGVLFINNVKLEIGDKATSFCPRNYGEELLMCQRYYEVSDEDESLFGYCNNIESMCTWKYKVTKRTKPSISVSHSQYGEGKLWVANTNSSYINAQCSPSVVDINHCRIKLSNESDRQTLGNSYITMCGKFTADSEIF